MTLIYAIPCSFLLFMCMHPKQGITIAFFSEYPTNNQLNEKLTATKLFYNTCQRIELPVKQRLELAVRKQVCTYRLPASRRRRR